jgi:hypothetical protein
MKLHRVIGGLSAAFLLSAGCSSSGSPDRSVGKHSVAKSAAPGTSAASTQPAQPALVGEWQRRQSCAELVAVLTRAGLQKRVLEAIATDGWIAGVGKVSQLKDPAHPCAGAAPRLHSHFFTADGDFGSRDEAGQQVDDGHYSLQGSDTLIMDGINVAKVAFHYKITGHDTLSLTPVMPRCPPNCEDAQWSVSVAYAGYTWHRIG